MAPLVVGEGTASAAGPPPGAVVVGVSGPDCPSPRSRPSATPWPRRRPGKTMFRVRRHLQRERDGQQGHHSARGRVRSVRYHAAPRARVDRHRRHHLRHRRLGGDHRRLHARRRREPQLLRHKQTAAGAEGYAWEDNIIENNAAAINVIDGSGTAGTLVRQRDHQQQRHGPWEGQRSLFHGALERRHHHAELVRREHLHRHPRECRDPLERSRRVRQHEQQPGQLHRPVQPERRRDRRQRREQRADLGGHERRLLRGRRQRRCHDQRQHH